MPRLLWQLRSVAVNRKTQKCIIYDERGQVYFLSIQQNIYKTVRLASTTISAIAFLLSRSTLIVTAYENGDVLMLDTDSDDVIVLSSQCPSMSSSTIRMIRAHPSESIVAMASDDRTISLWDLRWAIIFLRIGYFRHLHTLEFQITNHKLWDISHRCLVMSY